MTSQMIKKMMLLGLIGLSFSHASYAVKDSQLDRDRKKESQKHNLRHSLFSQLPSDVLALVLNNLPRAEIAQNAGVCHDFNEAARKTPKLRDAQKANQELFALLDSRFVA